MKLSKCLTTIELSYMKHFNRVKAIQETEKIPPVQLKPEEEPQIQETFDTKAPRERLEQVVNALVNLPEHFDVHKKLRRQFERRNKLFHEQNKVDWGFAEALAFGSLLLEGVSVRLAGQDSRRGTFSHRHAVLYDQSTGKEFIPLNNINEEQAKLLVYDSLLSEYAACGFEYGYSVANLEALVLWEAQFGDFANGAQIIYDQFFSASYEKWGQQSKLVLLLPHSYEGQGPEHSSARLERFLQMCAEGNMYVCNFTTPGNYFHALRRQVKQTTPRPMVVMAPKSLLRHQLAVSNPQELVEGTLQEVIPASIDSDENQIERLIFCSGKVYYDLYEALQKDDSKRGKIAITRMEQFYPFPVDHVKAQLERFRSAKDVIWVQEEPKNMGGWTFMQAYLNELLEEIHGTCENRVHYVGRKASASTATGSARVHQAEQERLITKALAI